MKFQKKYENQYLLLLLPSQDVAAEKKLFPNVQHYKRIKKNLPLSLCYSYGSLS
jgi:hypothetical protein